MSKNEKPVITIKGTAYFVGDWIKPSPNSKYMKNMYRQTARYRIVGLTKKPIGPYAKVDRTVIVEVFYDPSLRKPNSSSKMIITKGFSASSFRYHFDGKLGDKEILEALSWLM